MHSKNKLISLILLPALIITFTGSAVADIKCESGTLTGKSGQEGDPKCRISPDATEKDYQDISGEEYTASNVDIIVEQGGRIYTDHVEQTATNDASINLEDGNFIVKPGGAVHANINISAFNIRVEQGGVIDSSGLGWQPQAQAEGLGPGGGEGSTSNSGAGAGGGAYGGQGGTYDNSGNTNLAWGGDSYGDPEKANKFGSAGGGASTLDPLTVGEYDVPWPNGDADKFGHTNLETTGGNTALPAQTVETILKGATFGNGSQDDPDDDGLDSDYWISTNEEYREENPHAGDIYFGAGGGRIKLVANKRVNIDGAVISNGIDAQRDTSSSNNGGGGAGGSININAGGLFGNGTVMAKGGSYAERTDGSDSGSGKQIWQAAGGGGRIFYGYSIKSPDWDWNVSAEMGQSLMRPKDSLYFDIGPLTSDFSGNNPKHDNINSPDTYAAKNGSVVSSILFSAFLNESIVNPNEAFKLNGTSNSDVTVNITLPDGGNKTLGPKIEPRDSDGQYNGTKYSLDIQDTDDLGNYTLIVSSTISNNSINETFQLSHRTIDINQSSDYILKPDEQFNVNADLDLIKQDGNGGINRTDYENQPFNWSYNDADNIRNESGSTGSSASFSFTDTVPATRGLKYYQASTENSNGIKGFQRKDLSWMDINTSIVDPGQEVKINGTSHNSVHVYLENQSNEFEYRDTVNVEADGYFDYSLTTLNIQDEENIGNYTLKLKTKLNGANRTEKFEISHREIEINNNPDFFLKAGENLELDNNVTLYNDNGENDYNGTLDFNFYSQTLQSGPSKEITSSSGEYSYSTAFTPNFEPKWYTIETVNENGVNDLVSDDDLEDIENRSIAWADINTSIVDPGQYIKINGSSPNPVDVTLTGPEGDEPRGSINTDGSAGFSSSIQSLTREKLDNYSDMDNYTLELKTKLNGENRTENFEISYREVEFFHSTDYLLRPGEQFEVSGSAQISRGGGNESYDSTNYADVTDGPDLKFNYSFFNGTGENTSRPLIDDQGNFSTTSIMSNVKGNKSYLIEHENNNGINYLEDDNDLNNKSRKQLGLVSIDEYIVNPGEEIKVNGTAYNDVEITFNGTEVSGSPLTPDSSTGFFNNTFEVPQVGDSTGLGNQTLEVKTKLNGENRTEEFEVSLRGIIFSLDSGYPRRVNPDENFTVSGSATKYVADESGGSKPVDYQDETITIEYRDQDGEIQTKTTDTDRNGNFQIQDFESPPNAGDRTIEISTVNSEGITQERTETVKTQIRVENSTATSPHKRLFKDSNLDTSNFVNPEQDLKLQVDTRKSLDFVENVYANVTMPDETEKQVKLTAQNVLGNEFKSSQDWNDGNTTHLTHRTLKKDITSGKLRIGYQKQPEDDLLLEMPFEAENNDNLEDLSEYSNQISGSTDADTSGIFSTSGARFDGTNSLTLEDSKSLNLSSNFTISAWVKPSSQEGTIYERTDVLGNNLNPSLEVDDGKIKFKVRKNGNTNAEANAEVGTDNWYHIAGVYTEDSISIYIDGERKGTSPVGSNQRLEGFASGSVVIGDTGVSGQSDNYEGKIDNLRIFNSSLSEQRIKGFSKAKGSYETPPINTDKQVRDILKLLNFNGSLNNQEIRIQAFSDSNKSSSGYEEASEEIYLSNGTEIRSVFGFGNFSDRFKLNISLQTDNVSESPILSRIDFKARKDDKITWSSSRNIENFFDGLYGEYNVSYTAEDFGENKEDSLENTSFSVRDIEIEPDHKKKADPGEQVEITGNATVVKGDGTGNKRFEDFQGDLNILFGDKVQGQNQIDESLKFTELSGGTTRKVPVNGTESPRNAEITFFGKYEGIDETRSWNNASDWDQLSGRNGMTHSRKVDSSLGNETLTLGYSSKEVLGESLKNYYSMDDSQYPLSDSKSSENLDAINQPSLEETGILSTPAVAFNGSNGFKRDNLMGSNSEFTINLWIKPESIPDSQSKRQTLFSIKEKLKLEITEDAALRVESSKGTFSTDPDYINPEKWQMITLRQSPDTIGVSKNRKSFTGIDIGSAPDYSGKNAYIATDSSNNGFKGTIDELRIYSETVDNSLLKILDGELDLPPDSTFQQYIETETKRFSEQIKPGSLVLEADVETNGQRASVQVTDGSSTTERIRLENDQVRYQIPDQTLSENKDYGLRIEMDSNITHAPKVNELKLIRRFATENPEVDIDGDGSPEAEYTQSRILPGESQTVTLNNLTTGVNTASFDTQNGEFDARINYTEVLRNNTGAAVNVNSSGEFSTTLTVPQKSGSSEITYYTTNDNGIQGLNATTLKSSLKFTSENISDLTNGDKVVDPKDIIQLNATIAPTSNPIDTMWAEIETQQGPNITRELNNETYSGGVWNFTENVSNEIYDGDGEYTAKLNVNDTSGLEELSSPQLSFNVTNGTVSAEKTEETVGLGREFNLSGVVRQNLTSERQNATVNITFEVTGFSKTLSTDESGFYEQRIVAPDLPGSFPIRVESVDEDGITARNTTYIDVEDSTSLNTEILQDPVQITGLTFDNNKIVDVPIEINNTGNTDIKNLEVYAEDLPTTSNSDLVESAGATDWKSINHTYNLSSGSVKEVVATVNASKASRSNDYPINISTTYTTTGGAIKGTKDEVVMDVTSNAVVKIEGEPEANYEDGYNGNFIQPDDYANANLTNIGTARADQITWSIKNPRFNEWVNNTYIARDTERQIFPGGIREIEEINGEIPEGTPPGNYTTLLNASGEAGEFQPSNLTVKVEDTPKWNISISSNKSDVSAPSNLLEANPENPLQLGTIEFGSTGNLTSVELINEGNRNLTFETYTRIGKEDDEANVFYQNISNYNDGDWNQETFYSDIEPIESYKYDIDSPQFMLGYQTLSPGVTEGIYKANLTIKCTAESQGNQCNPKKAEIPMNATIKTTPPSVESFETPETVGTGSTKTIKGDLSDSQGVNKVEIKITKYLDSGKRTNTKTINFENTGVTSYEYSGDVNFDKPASEDTGTDKFGLQIIATDVNGKEGYSVEKNVTVKDRGSVNFQLDDEELVLKGVNAQSGDKVYMTGNVTNGNVTLEDVEISAEVSGTGLVGNTSQLDVVSVNGSDGTGLSLGDLSPGETESFNFTLDSVPDIDPSAVFYPTISISRTHPDGFDETGKTLVE
jgi:hypothetical protein